MYGKTRKDWHSIVKSYAAAQNLLKSISGFIVS
jgi:hypothetical protein